MTSPGNEPQAALDDTAPLRGPVPRAADTSPFGTHGPDGFMARLIGFSRRMPLSWGGRRLAYAARQLGLWALKGSPVDVESLGARMRLYPGNNVCEKRLLFTPQYFDPDERAHLERAIADGFVFVDIGANVGGYALFVAARAGAAGRVLAVEPQPAVFERLVYNIRQNPFGTVKAVDCAVADKAGELTLFVDMKNHGESSVKFVGLSGGPAVRVAAKTLQQLLEEEGFDHVDAIKLDVEGAEDLILEPFLRNAPESLLPRLLLIENGAGRWQIDLPAMLQEKGYRLVAKTRVNLIFERA
ncbi:MAG: FkbM family methyltransferase [Burkholderiales bacterium]|nr:FkbM family methyltransferase [Burkholderiales bacterium]